MVKIDILGFPHHYELSASTDSPVVLVFVHGWLLSRAYWQPIVDRLSPTYQCLTYDLRGFGQSQLHGAADRYSSVDSYSAVDSYSPQSTQVSQPLAVGATAKPMQNSTWDQATPTATARYTPAAYARDLNLLLQQLNIRKAWLVGHSLGGSIALWAASQAPQTIEGVICINSGGGIYLKEEFEQFRAVGKMLIKFRPRWLSWLPLMNLPFTRLNVARPISSVWARQRLLDLISAQPEAALGALLDSTTEAEVHRLPQLVASLRQPVHFIAGANDTLMESKYVHHLASFHASFEYCGNNVSEIADCGHLAMIEQPDAVTQAIRTLLTRYR